MRDHEGVTVRVPTARLSELAVEVYMSGPSFTAEALLGASSIGELADRIEFVGTVAESDAVSCPAGLERTNPPRISGRGPPRDRVGEREALDAIRADEAALHAGMECEADLVAELEDKEAAAAVHTATLDEQREDYLDSLEAAATLPTTSSTTPTLCGAVGPRVCTGYSIIDDAVNPYPLLAQAC